MSESTIPTDVPESFTTHGDSFSFEDVDPAAAAYLARRKALSARGAPEPEAGGKVADPEETGAETADDGAAEPESQSEEPEDRESETEDAAETQAEKRVASDSDEVLVKVGDQELRVSVKDLKRLYGQEAALTRKSQETAALREMAEQTKARHEAALERLVQKAEEQWKQYEQIDFDLLARNPQVSDQAFKALKEEAAQAKANLDFLRGELDQTVQARREEEQKRLAQAAVEARKVITDPGHQYHIPNWGGETYQGLFEFASRQLGMPREVFATIVNPAELKLLWMAQQYDRISQGARQAKPKPVAKAAPRQTVQPKAAEVKGEADDLNRLRERARRTGNAEDVQAYYVAKLKAARV